MGVHNIVKQLPIKRNRVALGGFSQGGAIALLATLSFPETLAGCAIYGGWLSQPAAEASSTEWINQSNAATPIWWGHGSQDNSIPVQLQDEHSEILDRLRPLQPVKRMRYSGGHWPSQGALQDLFKWFCAVPP